MNVAYINNRLPVQTLRERNYAVNQAIASQVEDNTLIKTPIEKDSSLPSLYV